MKIWKTPTRNWKGIRFEVLRKQVDPKFNQAHDALSAAYYEEKPFLWKGKDWGILDEKTFGKLHGLIFDLRHIAFHAENKRQPPEKQIPEEEYNQTLDSDGAIVKRTVLVAKNIKELKNQGIELEV